MIDAKCQCGAVLEVHEHIVGREATCGACNGVLRFASAEALADGTGAGDFDAKLVITAGPDHVGEQILLGGVADVSIGKSPERQIQLPAGKLVSRAHAKLARIDFGPSRWRIDDTNSTNGLLVNGQRVSSHELKDGDVVGVGDYEMRFVSTYVVRQAVPTYSGPGAVACPSCTRSLPPDTKICVDCGIDVTTGRPLVVSRGLDEDDLAIRTDTWIRVISWVMPLGLMPIASEAFGTRRPITTWVITAVTALASTIFMIAIMASDEEDPPASLMNLMHWVGDPELVALEDDGQITIQREEADGTIGFRWWQLLTHALLHDPAPLGFVFHLGGNLLFLWVFGMRVNEVLGNAKFAAVYPILAVGSAFVDGIINAHQPMYPTIGASGAIMGLAGMYLVFFPVQRVHMVIWCRWWLVFFPAVFQVGFACGYKTFAWRGFWLLVLWILWNDVLPVAIGWNDEVSHWAHLGGFVTGAALAALLLITRQADAHRGDLLSVVLGRYAWWLLGRPGAKAAAAG